MAKKAWQIELETMQNSIPVVLKQEEQGWNYAETLEMVEDAAVAMKWHSNVPGSHAEEHVIIGGMQDMANMGYDVSAAEAMIEQGQKYLKEGNKSALAGHTARTWHVMMNSPKIPDHPYWKHTIYGSFEQYAAAVTFPSYEYDMSGEDFLRRTHLGWQGQIVAGAIGTAVEGYVTENIRKVFEEVATAYGFDAWGFDSRDYVTITHFYTNPLYTISYVVSNDAAFQLYQMEQENPGSGLKLYKNQLNCGDIPFLTFIDNAGLTSPFTSGRAASIRQTMEEIL